MKRVFLFLMIGTFFASCGYHSSLSEEQGRTISLTIPYIPGDAEAALQAELTTQLVATGKFFCVQRGGEYSLQVKLLTDEQDRIGFRYDRDNPSGKREKNLLGVESRRTATAEVSLIEVLTGKCLMGPFLVCSSVDFDYTDPGSPRDLLFARKVPIMQFSLGQLDSSEGAFDDAIKPLVQKLSQKIVLGLQDFVD